MSSDPAARRSAERGLDLLNLFIANIQTGFGPFIAVYLVSRGWTQTAIGFALSIGTVTSMLSQVPAGALVDAVPGKSGVGCVSLFAFGASAMLLAATPVPLGVYLAEVLHGISSCTLGPVIAAISLEVAGHAGLEQRLSRNTRFAALGNGLGASLMGACGYYLSERSVFVLTAVLTLPPLIALLRLVRVEPAATDSPPPQVVAAQHKDIRRVLADRRLVGFAAAIALFTFANAAMLPLAGATLAKEGGGKATLLIAACIVLPQLVVALISPWLGRLAEERGRRSILLLGFCVLPLRGALLAVVANPAVIVLAQTLDGVAGACIGIMIPLVTADIAGDSGHYSASFGFVSLAMGLGSTISTTVAGAVADRLGDPAAFAALTCAGLAAVLIGARLPETKPAANVT